MPEPTGPGAVVRPATTADTDDLVWLRWEWRSGQGEPLEMDAAEFRHRFAIWVADHRSSHLPFVAEVDGTVVGIAWLAVLERVPGPDRWDRRSAMVQSVYVTPAHRSVGIGTALVASLIDEAHAQQLDYLGVHPSQPSFPMYRRLGFAPYAGTLELDVKATRVHRA